MTTNDPPNPLVFNLSAPQGRPKEVRRVGHVEKHHGKYLARYRDVSGRTRSKSFTLKADAERWVREEEVALERGSWIDRGRPR